MKDRNTVETRTKTIIEIEIRIKRGNRTQFIPIKFSEDPTTPINMVTLELKPNVGWRCGTVGHLRSPRALL